MNCDLDLFQEKLLKLIKQNNYIFISGHKNADLDSFGASIGVNEIVRSIKKDAYIILDDSSELESGVKTILENVKDKFRIISSNDSKIEKLKKDALLIVVDANKGYRIPIEDLDEFKDIVVIDHHAENMDTIKTKYKYIDSENFSSASEIVSRMLFNNKKIAISKDAANSLHAGMILDTKRFERKTTKATYDMASFLVEGGANNDFAVSLFLEDLNEYTIVRNLVLTGIALEMIETKKEKYTTSFVLNRNEPNTQYSTIQLSKAGDQAMKIKGIDAAFILGYINENIIQVTARTSGGLNAHDIMSAIGGGGKETAAVCQIESKSQNIFEVEEKLKNKVKSIIKEKY